MVLGLDWGMKAWRSESDTEHDEKYHHPSFHFPPFTSPSPSNRSDSNMYSESKPEIELLRRSVAIDAIVVVWLGWPGWADGNCFCS